MSGGIGLRKFWYCRDIGLEMELGWGMSSIGFTDLMMILLLLLLLLLLLVIARFLNHRSCVLCRWRRNLVHWNIVLWLRLLRKRMVVKFIPVLSFCLNLALNLRCLLFLSLILLDGSVKGLLDLLSSRCKVNMAQLW